MMHKVVVLLLSLFTVAGVAHASEEPAPFDYLNQLRQQAGMIPFTYNEALAIAAQNHSNYLHRYRQGGHGERSGRRGYTGSTHSQRAIHAGYMSRNTSENVSYHSDRTLPRKSVDGLMSAIYHRFGFLTFKNNEAGAGHAVSNQFSAYTYVMGSSAKNAICQGQSDMRSRRYLYEVCADTQFRVNPQAMDQAEHQIQSKNPDVVVWPAPDTVGIPPAFYEEDPDPLPDYAVSGYPVSVQFNPAVFAQSPPVLTRFEIYRVSDNYKLEDTRYLNEQYDRNRKFNWNEHALFPLQRLQWNTQYRAEVDYRVGEESYNLNWQFTTEKLPMPMFIINHDTQPIKLEHNQAVAFYVPPRGARDGQGSVRTTTSMGMRLDVQIYDNHTLIVKSIGQTGRATLDFHGVAITVVQ